MEPGQSPAALMNYSLARKPRRKISPSTGPTAWPRWKRRRSWR